MRTYYILLVAIFLPKLLLSTTPTNKDANYDLKDNLSVIISDELDIEANSISLPDIICPATIDSILPSRRDCEAVIDYNVGFNTSNCPISQFNLEQNFSDNDIVAFSCDGTVETSHIRVFDLSQSGLPSQVFLTGVDVGVGFASTMPEITVNVYTLNGPLLYANMTLLESLKATVPVISAGIFTIPADILVSNSDMVVVELIAPPFDVAQVPGYNIGGGQSAPSFIASPGCNIPEPIDIASFGQPDFNLVLKLKASDFSIQQTAGIESGGAFPAGTTTNTFELSDPAGNSTSCSFDVNVSYGVDPFLICPLNIDTTSQPNECGAVVTFDVFVLEECPGDSIFQITGIPSGGVFPPGFTRNEYVAIDIFGATDTCRFDVFVEDIDAPVIDCIEDIVISVENNECTSVVDFDINASDFCGTATIAQTSGLPSGFAFPVGVTTNIFVATDDAGNSSECSFNIIVEDGSTLTFATCPSDTTVSTITEECGAIVNFELPSVTGSTCDSMDVSIRQNFSNTVVSSFGCDQSIESRHLRVFDMPRMGINGDFLIEQMDIGIGFTDTNSPQIDLNIYHLETEEVLYENMTLVFSRQYLLPSLADTTYTISVNHLVPRGQKVVVELVVPEVNTTRFIAGYSNEGEFRESYFAAPACGYTEPVLLSNIGFDLALVMQLNGTVTNNRLVEQTTGLTRGSLFPLGTTTNTFTLDDGSTCSFDVTVVDGTAPSIVCPADITTNILGNRCDTMVMVDLPIVEDNCSAVTITNDINNMESASDIFVNGSTPVTYIATDATGNSSTCVVNVNVVGMFEAEVMSTNVSCFGGNDGEIILNIASGTPPFQYNWSNGQTTPNLSMLAADTYGVTIQDSSLCTFETTIVITEPTELLLDNLLINNSVNGADNGNINIDIVGGSAPYTYAWSNGNNEANITNLAPGDYDVTVTDDNGCVLILGPYTIEGVVSTKDVLETIPVSVYPNPTNNLINIELGTTRFGDINYQIINPLGMVLQNGALPLSTAVINVGDYPEGIYYLVLNAKEGQSFTPFVVQR